MPLLSLKCLSGTASLTRLEGGEACSQIPSSGVGPQAATLALTLLAVQPGRTTALPVPQVLICTTGSLPKLMCVSTCYTDGNASPMSAPMVRIKLQVRRL